MSQSPDEANYHHLHLHTIIAHQKGHVPLCQAAADIIPPFASNSAKIFCTRIYTHGIRICIVHGNICICMHGERQRAIQVAYTYSGQKKQKVIGERDLIPCGKREEIFAYVCKALDYHWRLWITCVHQGNLL